MCYLMLFTLFFQFLYDSYLRITGKGPVETTQDTETDKENKPKAE